MDRKYTPQSTLTSEDSNSGSSHSSDSDEDFSRSLCSVDEWSNPVQWIAHNEAYCFDLERFTKKYIDAVLKKAVEEVQPKGMAKTDEVVDETDISRDLVAESNTPQETPTSELWKWPKISEFNIKLGLEKVQDYVGAWKLSPVWLYCVEFLGWESEDCSNIFVYEVEWSKPTNAYPIPQVTASVYFALEVFKMVPSTFDREIGVSYVFEASNVIHIPGDIDFQEKWLEDVLSAKLKFFKTVAFLGPRRYDKVKKFTNSR